MWFENRGEAVAILPGLAAGMRSDESAVADLVSQIA
jgi:hypothetical protein